MGCDYCNNTGTVIPFVGEAHPCPRCTVVIKSPPLNDQPNFQATLNVKFGQVYDDAAHKMVPASTAITAGEGIKRFMVLNSILYSGIKQTVIEKLAHRPIEQQWVRFQSYCRSVLRVEMPDDYINKPDDVQDLLKARVTVTFDPSVKVTFDPEALNVPVFHKDDPRLAELLKPIGERGRFEISEGSIIGGGVYIANHGLPPGKLVAVTPMRNPLFQHQQAAVDEMMDRYDRDVARIDTSRTYADTGIIPARWAQESEDILQENMIAGWLVKQQGKEWPECMQMPDGRVFQRGKGKSEYKYQGQPLTVADCDMLRTAIEVMNKADCDVNYESTLDPSELWFMVFPHLPGPASRTEIKVLKCVRDAREKSYISEGAAYDIAKLPLMHQEAALRLVVPGIQTFVKYTCEPQKDIAFELSLPLGATVMWEHKPGHKYKVLCEVKDAIDKRLISPVVAVRIARQVFRKQRQMLTTALAEADGMLMGTGATKMGKSLKMAVARGKRNMPTIEDILSLMSLAQQRISTDIQIKDGQEEDRHKVWLLLREMRVKLQRVNVQMMGAVHQSDRVPAMHNPSESVLNQEVVQGFNDALAYMNEKRPTEKPASEFMAGYIPALKRINDGRPHPEHFKKQVEADPDPGADSW